MTKMHETNTIKYILCRERERNSTHISYQLLAFISFLLIYILLNWNWVTNWSIFDKHYEMANLAKGNWKLVLKLAAAAAAITAAATAEELMFMRLRHGNNNRLRPIVYEWALFHSLKFEIKNNFLEFSPHLHGIQYTRIHSWKFFTVWNRIDCNWIESNTFGTRNNGQQAIFRQQHTTLDKCVGGFRGRHYDFHICHSMKSSFRISTIINYCLICMLLSYDNLYESPKGTCNVQECVLHSIWINVAKEMDARLLFQKYRVQANLR